jgi:hypothetical protein
MIYTLLLPKLVIAPRTHYRSEVMSELQESVSRLRSEIESALSRDFASSAEGGFTTESATVCLGLVHEPESSERVWRLARSGEDVPPVHSLTIHFRRNASSGSASSATPAELSSTPARPVPISVPVPAESELFESLQKILGKPGFDNAARAEVLGEWLSSVTPLEASQLLEWCSNPGTQPPSQPLQGAWNRIRRVLGFSSIGAPAAAHELNRLLQRHSIAEVVTEMDSRWKFGTHWQAPA